MVSPRERDKLLQDFRHEPASAAALLLKCAAGLLLVVGVALIGVSTDRNQDVTTPNVQAQGSGSTSPAESRKSYQEQRARFQAPEDARGAVIRASPSRVLNTAEAPKTDAQ
jgi:hypothetical protein